MNTTPASSSDRCITSTGRSIGTPSASSTSALPDREVKERLPCFATRAPAPAARSAAAVEMLNVWTAPPPVPHVSTSWSGRSAGSATIAERSERATAATTSGVSPRTRSPMRSAATCAGVASPRITTSNAAVIAAAPSGCPEASRRTASRSASPPACAGGAAGGVVMRRSRGPAPDEIDEALGELCVRRHEGDHHPQQTHPLHVGVGVRAVGGSVGQVDDAHQLAVVHQRQADEAPAREILVAEQRVRLRLAHVAYEERLARLGHLPRAPLADADARPLVDVPRAPARGREIEMARLRRAEHERAPLRVRVVADEREEPVHELTRVVRRGVEREDAVEEVECPHRLPQRLGASVELDLPLLELTERGGELLLQQLDTPLGAPHRLRLLRGDAFRRQRLARRIRRRAHG